MNNPLRHLLFVVILALAALPGTGRAASGDYVSLQVPDVSQAVGFFHDVMNCDLIAQTGAGDARSAAMLDCGDGNTVELVQAGTASKARAPSSQQVISFATDNAVAATAWLRANHVVIVGQPVRTAAGSDGEKVTVDFMAPWGQPMRLVSHASADALSAANRLAAQ